MSSSWWMLIRSRLPDPVGGFIFIPVRKVHQKISLAAVMQRKTTRFRVCTNDRKRFIIKEKRLWNYFNSAIEVLQTLVVALGAGLGVWGAINLLEGYGNDNPGSNAHVR